LLGQANGIDPFLPGVGGDDLRIELPGGLQVVIDAADARLLEVAGLLFIEPAQGGAVANAIGVMPVSK
jgi:hypothetical protein